MPTGDSASGDTDDRQADGDGAVTRRTVLRGAAAAAFAGAAVPSATRSTAARADPAEWRSIRLDAADASEAFGTALAVDGEGERLVVGDPLRSDGDVRTGGVSVYAREGDDWTREALLQPAYRARLDHVGASVDVNAAGDRLVVGVPGEDAVAGQCGAASVYVREGGSWTHEAKLIPEDAAQRDRLGRAVSIDDAGERVLVGAPADDAHEPRPGTAYVFDRTAESGEAVWERAATLSPADGAPGDLAGAALSLSGDGRTALVGAPGASDGEGSVTAFTDDPWSPIQSVENSTDAAAAFGSAVATNGDDGVITAPRAAESEGSDADSGSDGSEGTDAESAATGFAGVFDGVEWSMASRLSAADGPAGERFGVDAAVTADGDSAVVGGVFDGDLASEGDGSDGDSETDSGESDDAVPTGGARVYVSGDDGWAHARRLTPDDPTAMSRFGRAVATDADGHVVAVAGQRTGATGAAAAPDSSAVRSRTAPEPAGTVSVFRRESPRIEMTVEPDESWPATIHYDGAGEVTVAIEQTESFDPANVAVETLRFGPPRVVDDGGGARAVDDGTERDVDGDGDGDLVVRFPVEDAGFAADDFAARLVGETRFGTPFEDHTFVMTTADPEDGSDGRSGSNGTGDGNATDGGTNGTDGGTNAAGSGPF
ncbi:MAG: hypothetical protein ABEJ26_04065 [Halosimplex sp.]